MADRETSAVDTRAMNDLNRSVKVPSGKWWRRMLSFVGPAYMVSVGYMDPGNWATDIAGGAQFGYTLIWILLLSNAMAVMLQTLAARLGLVTGHDLAQACRETYNPVVRWALFILCEIAIAATDLAELLGTAIGLNILFGLPLLWAVIITGFDVLLLLVMQRAGIRKMEAFIVMLISVIGVCFLIEIFLSKPQWGGVVQGFQPTVIHGEALLVAIGILGATVMPHNLYLHSSLVQSRDVNRSVISVAQACRYNLVDSVVALNLAFLVNASILVVAGTVFFGQQAEVTLQQAPQLLHNLLGSKVAAVAFSLALICAGQSSTLTGTLAGQITMEGFLKFRMRPWARRLITRLAALVPAIVVIALAKGRESEGVFRLLILSQVVLSLQLPFAVVPLVKFTGSKRKMGPFASPRWLQGLAWLATAMIVGLNAMLVSQEVQVWTGSAGAYGWAVLAGIIPVVGLLGALLAWMILRRESPESVQLAVTADKVAQAAVGESQRFQRVGVALEANEHDGPMLAEAISMARAHGAELVLMHVVEGVGGQWFGPQTGDMESRQDDVYLRSLSDRLHTQLQGQGIGAIRPLLGFGDVPRELVRLARQENIDLLVVGGHGHRGLSDLLHGQTIDVVRHGLKIPIMAVRRKRE